MSEAKHYIGDSVYADTDGFGILLTTENGHASDPSNSVYLEPAVLTDLFKYAVRLNILLPEDLK